MIDNTVPIKERLRNCLTSTLLLILYVLVGAVLFVKIEKPYSEEHSALELTKLENLTAILNKTKHQLNLLRENDNNTTKKLTELYADSLNLSEALVSEISTKITRKTLPWTFYTAVHFCLTAITTIGYGYITPVSQLGRGICIPYIIFGIPINVFCTSNIGFFVASAVVKLYQILSKVSGIVKNIISPPTEKRETPSTARPDDPDQQHEGTSTRSLCKISEDTDGGTEMEFVNHGNSESGFRSEIYVEEDNHCTGENNHIKENNHSESQYSDDQGDASSVTPLWFVVLLLVMFCSMVSYLIKLFFENWTCLDSVYFVVATFTTVGFGDMDIFYTAEISEANVWLIIISMAVLMEVGLIVMAGTIQLCIERFSVKAKEVKDTLEKKRQSIVNTIS